MTAGFIGHGEPKCWICHGSLLEGRPDCGLAECPHIAQPVRGGVILPKRDWLPEFEEKNDAAT